jgi:DNA-binding NarL/FixJ family response regulator
MTLLIGTVRADEEEDTQWLGSRAMDRESGGVLIVEDNDDIRYLLGVMVDLTEGLEVTGVATNAEDGLALFRESAPDVVLLDYRLPGRDGLDIATEMLAERPEQPIVLFSAYLDDATIGRAESVGIRECVSKDEITRLPDVIRKYTA